MLGRIPLAGLQGVGRALRGGGSYLNQMTLVGIEAPLRHDRTIGHLGMTKMKAMVQSCCYWKNAYRNIENLGIVERIVMKRRMNQLKYSLIHGNLSLIHI